MTLPASPREIGAPEQMRQAYDRLARRYHADRERFDLREVYTAFRRRLPEHGAVLDLGCGAGDSVSSYFTRDGWSAVGYDFSPAMLALAAKNNPALKRICRDLRRIRPGQERYEAAIAIYSLFHLRVEEQFTLLGKVFRALKPGGGLLFTYGLGDEDEPEEVERGVSFMGETLYYAHTRPDRLCRRLCELGFVDIELAVREIGGERFLWCCCTKPGAL